MEEKVIQERLYNYNAGGCCGVLMPENVMKRIAKLNAKYSQEVRRILQDHKDELYVSDWTMAASEDKQEAVYVYYTKEGDTVDHRIDLFKADTPEYRGEVYLVKDYNEAKEIAERKLKESKNDQ